jgi:ketosteroid isomerase-like protein
LRKQDSDPVPASTGNYFTIWKKQANGGWKVLLDLGTANPPPRNAAPAVDPDRAAPPALPATIAPAKVPELLLQLDRKWAEAAIAAPLSADVRLLLSNYPPAIGIERVRALLEKEGPPVLTPLHSGAAVSGDLGYTYGSFRSAEHSAWPATGYYVRVWRLQRSGEWQIEIEVAAG